MKKIFFLVFLPITFIAGAQSTFEKGYVIDNDSKKIECYIKYQDWQFTPNVIKYRLTKDGEINSIDIDNVKEFGDGENYKYVRYIGKIDVSSMDFTELDYRREPNWEERKVFLKVLISGVYNLYSYSTPALKRYFYSIQDREIIQLVYKQYLVDPKGHPLSETNNRLIAKNESYKQQLLNNVKCEGISINRYKSLDYSDNSLLNLFKAIYKCSDVKYSFYFNQKRSALNLKFLPGVTYTGIKVSYDNVPEYEFEKKLLFTPSLEFEYVLPYYNYSWSLYVNTIYQTYNSNNMLSTLRSIKLNTIEVPVGLRYYFINNERMRISVNTSVSFNFQFNSGLYNSNDERIKLFHIKPNLRIGGTYSLKKLTFVVSYQFNKDLFNYEVIRYVDYDGLTFQIGYTLLGD